MIQTFDSENYPTYLQYADEIAKFALEKDGRVWFKKRCYTQVEALSAVIATSLRKKTTARLWIHKGDYALNWYELSLYKAL